MHFFLNSSILHSKLDFAGGIFKFFAQAQASVGHKAGAPVGDRPAVSDEPVYASVEGMLVYVAVNAEEVNCC